MEPVQPQESSQESSPDDSQDAEEARVAAEEAAAEEHEKSQASSSGSSSDDEEGNEVTVATTNQQRKQTPQARTSQRVHPEPTLKAAGVANTLSADGSPAHGQSGRKGATGRRKAAGLGFKSSHFGQRRRKRGKREKKGNAVPADSEDEEVGGDEEGGYKQKVAIPFKVPKTGDKLWTLQEIADYFLRDVKVLKAINKSEITTEGYDSNLDTDVELWIPHDEATGMPYGQKRDMFLCKESQKCLSPTRSPYKICESCKGKCHTKCIPKLSKKGRQSQSFKDLWYCPSCDDLRKRISRENNRPSIGKFTDSMKRKAAKQDAFGVDVETVTTKKKKKKTQRLNKRKASPSASASASALTILSQMSQTQGDFCHNDDHCAKPEGHKGRCGRPCTIRAGDGTMHEQRFDTLSDCYTFMGGASRNREAIKAALENGTPLELTEKAAGLQRGQKSKEGLVGKKWWVEYTRNPTTRSSAGGRSSTGRSSTRGQRQTPAAGTPPSSSSSPTLATKKRRVDPANQPRAAGESDGDGAADTEDEGEESFSASARAWWQKGEQYFDKCSKVGRENTQLKKQVASLKKSKDDEVAQLKKQVASLKKSNEGEVAQLKKQVASLEESNKELKKKIELVVSAVSV